MRGIIIYCHRRKFLSIHTYSHHILHERDICGIISGALAASLVILLWDTPIFSIILTAIVSSLTVGSKAIGKKLAIKHADTIIGKVGIIISRLEFKHKEK